MTQKEFEERMGREVTTEEYAAADAAYMASGDDVDKDRFCAMYKTKAGLYELVGMLSARIGALQRLNGEMRRSMNETGVNLLGVAEDIQNGIVSAGSVDKVAYRLMGQREYLREKLDRGFTLTDNDRAMLIGIL